MKKIGARNIKTAISVFICLLIYRAVGQPYSFFACIAAVICTQNSVENSFVMSQERMIGTIMGGTLGYLLIVLFGNNPFVIGIGIVLLIHLGNSLNKKQAIVIACIVFLAIMIHIEEVSPLEYTISRVIDTSVGIVVAILVNKYLQIERFKLFRRMDGE